MSLSGWIVKPKEAGTTLNVQSSFSNASTPGSSYSSSSSSMNEFSSTLVTNTTTATSAKLSINSTSQAPKSSSVPMWALNLKPNVMSTIPSTPIQTQTQTYTRIQTRMQTSPTKTESVSSMSSESDESKKRKFPVPLIRKDDSEITNVSKVSRLEIVDIIDSPVNKNTKVKEIFNRSSVIDLQKDNRKKRSEKIIPATWPIMDLSNTSKISKTSKVDVVEKKSIKSLDGKNIMNPTSLMNQSTSTKELSSSSSSSSSKNSSVSITKLDISSKINPFFASTTDKKKAKAEEIESKFLEQLEESKRQQAVIFRPKDITSNSTNTTTTVVTGGNNRSDSTIGSGLGFFGKVKEQMKDRKEHVAHNQVMDNITCKNDIIEVMDLSMMRQYGIPTVEEYIRCLSNNLISIPTYSFVVYEDRDDFTSFTFRPFTDIINPMNDQIFLNYDDPYVRDNIEPDLYRHAAYGLYLRELFTSWKCELLFQQQYKNQPQRKASVHNKHEIIDLSQCENENINVNMNTVVSSYHLPRNRNPSISTVLQFMEVWAGKRRSFKKKSRQGNENHRTSGHRPYSHRNRSYDSDEDDGYIDSDGEDPPNLVNPLIITGSTASGKTSSVYSCAEQIGFHVIEVSIPSIKGGTELLKRCSEAVKSYGLNLQSNDLSFQGLAMTSMHGSGQSNSSDMYSTNCSNSNNSSNNTLNLILLDEMDICFESDGEKRINTAVIELVKSSKVPIIITSESMLSWYDLFLNCEIAHFHRIPCDKNINETGIETRLDQNLQLLSLLTGGDRRAIYHTFELLGVDGLNGGNSCSDSSSSSIKSNHNSNHIADDWYSWLAEKQIDIASYDNLYYRISSILPNSNDNSISSNSSMATKQTQMVYIPTIFSIEPSNGPITGGNLITIHGKNFLQFKSVSNYMNSKRNDEMRIEDLYDVSVRIGPYQCEEIAMISDTEIIVRVPNLSIISIQSILLNHSDNGNGNGNRNSGVYAVVVTLHITNSYKLNSDSSSSSSDSWYRCKPIRSNKQISLLSVNKKKSKFIKGSVISKNKKSSTKGLLKKNKKSTVLSSLDEHDNDNKNADSGSYYEDRMSSENTSDRLSLEENDKSSSVDNHDSDFEDDFEDDKKLNVSKKYLSTNGNKLIINLKESRHRPHRILMDDDDDDDNDNDNSNNNEEKDENNNNSNIENRKDEKDGDQCVSIDDLVISMKTTTKVGMVIVESLPVIDTKDLLSKAIDVNLSRKQSSISDHSNLKIENSDHYSILIPFHDIPLSMKMNETMNRDNHTLFGCKEDWMVEQSAMECYSSYLDTLSDSDYMSSNGILSDDCCYDDVMNENMISMKNMNRNNGYGGISMSITLANLTHTLGYQNLCRKVSGKGIIRDKEKETDEENNVLDRNRIQQSFENCLLSINNKIVESFPAQPTSIIERSESVNICNIIRNVNKNSDDDKDDGEAHFSDLEEQDQEYDNRTNHNVCQSNMTENSISILSHADSMHYGRLSCSNEDHTHSKNHIFSRFNYLLYQEQKEKLTKVILNICNHACGPNQTDNNVLFNNLRIKSIASHLTLDVIPILGQILLSEKQSYEYQTNRKDMTNVNRFGRHGRNTRTVSKLTRLKYNHVASAIGLGEASLEQMLHLAYFGRNCQCCRPIAPYPDWML